MVGGIQILHEDYSIVLRLKHNSNWEDLFTAQEFNNSIRQGCLIYTSLQRLASFLHKNKPQISLEEETYYLQLSEPEIQQEIIQRWCTEGILQLDSALVVVRDNDRLNAVLTQEEQRHSKPLIQINAVSNFTKPIYIETQQSEKSKIKTRKPWSFLSIFSSTPVVVHPHEIIDFAQYGQFDPRHTPGPKDLTAIRRLSGRQDVYCRLEDRLYQAVSTSPHFKTYFQPSELSLAAARHEKSGLICTISSDTRECRITETYNSQPVIAKMKIVGQNLEVVSTKAFRHRLLSGEEVVLLCFNLMVPHDEGDWKRVDNYFIQLPFLTVEEEKTSLLCQDA